MPELQPCALLALSLRLITRLLFHENIQLKRPDFSFSRFKVLTSKLASVHETVDLHRTCTERLASRSENTENELAALPDCPEW